MNYRQNTHLHRRMTIFKWLFDQCPQDSASNPLPLWSTPIHPSKVAAFYFLVLFSVLGLERGTGQCPATEFFLQSQCTNLRSRQKQKQFSQSAQLAPATNSWAFPSSCLSSVVPSAQLTSDACFLLWASVSDTGRYCPSVYLPDMSSSHRW